VERKIVAGLYKSIKENINVEDNPVIQAPENFLAVTCKYASREVPTPMQEALGRTPTVWIKVTKSIRSPQPKRIYIHR
jgi:hypothetical protein